MFRLGSLGSAVRTSLCNQILGNKTKRNPSLVCATLMTNAVQKPAAAETKDGINIKAIENIWVSHFSSPWWLAYLTRILSSSLIDIICCLPTERERNENLINVCMYTHNLWMRYSNPFLAIAMMISIFTRILSSSLIDITCCLPTERGENNKLNIHTYTYKKTIFFCSFCSALTYI